MLRKLCESVMPDEAVPMAAEVCWVMTNILVNTPTNNEKLGEAGACEGRHSTITKYAQCDGYN